MVIIDEPSLIVRPSQNQQVPFPERCTLPPAQLVLMQDVRQS